MRKILGLLTSAAILFGILAHPAGGQTVQGPGSAAPAIGSASGILFELQSGKVFWAKDDRVVRAPASLTKILTALVVLENGNLDSVTTITPEARNAPGGRMFAEEGWTFTIRDLLYGLLLESGNDAAVALAQKVSPDGTIATFTKMMTDRAHGLGAIDSNFVNPHGMDEPGQVTTSRDLAIIITFAMKNPFFREIVATKTKEIPWGDGQPRPLINHNKLLWHYPDSVGIKTGFTNGAAHCLASAVSRGETTLVTVLLGSPDGRHYDETVALYDWAFANIDLLRSSPLAEIRAAPAESATSTENSEAPDLDIIQLGEQVSTEEQRTNPTTAPLLAPLLALAAAGGVGMFFTRRRRRSKPPLITMSEFRRELEALAPESIPEPEQIR